MQIATNSKQATRVFSETCKFFVKHVEAQKLDNNGVKEAIGHTLIVGAASLAAAAGDMAFANALASFGAAAEKKEQVWKAIREIAAGPGNGASEKQVAINWPALKRQTIAFLLGAVIAGVFFRFF